MAFRAQTPQPAIHYRTAELRAASDGAGFSGYASHFWSVDTYGTAIKPGAFRKTIDERGARTPVLWQHNPDWPIGKTTLLREDRTGLRFDAAISEATTHGRDVMALVRDDVPIAMSFGFQTTKERPATEKDPVDFRHTDAGIDDVRIIEEVKLWEISAVTFPANEQAIITDVRRTAEAEAVASLLERLRAGSLSAADDALAAEFVAAYEARIKPEPEPSTPLAARKPAPSRADVDKLLARLQLSGLLGAY